MLEQQSVPSKRLLIGDLTILYVSVFLTRIGFGAIVIIFPSYVHAGPFIAGVVLALYPIIEAGSALPVGRYLDKGGRRKRVNEQQEEEHRLVSRCFAVYSMLYIYLYRWSKYENPLLYRDPQQLGQGH